MNKLIIKRKHIKILGLVAIVFAVFYVLSFVVGRVFAPAFIVAEVNNIPKVQDATKWEMSAKPEGEKGVLTIEFKTPKSNEEVIDFYKTEMTKKGWNFTGIGTVYESGQLIGSVAHFSKSTASAEYKTELTMYADLSKYTNHLWISYTRK